MARPRYDRFSVLLHWLMAAALLAQLALGFWMIGLPKGDGGGRADWFNVHKSIGMLLGLLALVRLAWALARPRVEAFQPGRSLEHVARWSHRLLYALMLVAPLSGFMGSVFSKYPIHFFGLRLPKLAPHWEAAKEMLSVVHLWSVSALLALAALHVLAFAYHQFVRREDLIRRMR